MRRPADLPIWLWLAALVVASAAVRVVLAEKIAAPWIMVDELIYSELAKSFATHGTFEIRGVPAAGYGFVYPILIAPAWRLFHATTTAYDAAKAIDAAVMSLAAIPAYLLGRRALSAHGALAVAALAVLVPSMLYTGTLMTENAFYPLFLAVTLLLVATLERPTPARQASLLALLALAFETRQQGAVLVPAAAVAPVLHGILERDLVLRLRHWLTFYALGLAAALAVVLAYTIRGRSPLAVLGAYRGVLTGGYSWPTAIRYALWHVAELDLYVGVVPFAALVLLWLAARRSSAPLRAFAAATFSIALMLVLEVAPFASKYSLRIEERYLFYLAPFAFIALLCVVEGTVVVAGRRAAIGIAVAGALPATIPFDRFVNSSATPDTLALLPWWSLHDHGLAFGTMRFAALGASLIAAALLLTPRRFRLVPVLVVGAYLAGVSAIAYAGRHGAIDAARQTVHAGIHGQRYDWVDRAVGARADVIEVWDGTAPIQSVWETEFFNQSVRDVVATTAPYPDGLPVTQLAIRPDGSLVTAAGRSYTARFALAPPSLALAGMVVARDPQGGLRLVRVDGLLASLTTVSGLYPGDVWSGRTVTYTRRACHGGRLDVALASDPSLFTIDQTVTASEHGRPIAHVAVPPTSNVRLRVPLRPNPAGDCVVRFMVAELRVPREVHPGSTDTRRLGVRFLGIDYFG
jgi:hypothetical protein